MVLLQASDLGIMKKLRAYKMTAVGFTTRVPVSNGQRQSQRKCLGFFRKYVKYLDEMTCVRK